MPTTALTAAVALSNPSGASPAKFTMDTADATNENSFTNAPNLVVLARNDHGVTARTVSVRDVAGTDLTNVSLAAGEQVILGPFDPDLYGTTVTIDPETTDVKLRVVNIAASRTARTALESAKATVDAAWGAADTVPGDKRALRRVAHKLAVALRRVNGTNPDPLQHEKP